MSGPYNYSNWLKNNPVTTNGVYGFLIRKQMLEEKCEKKRKELERLKEEMKVPKITSISPKLYTAILNNDFIHKRKETYYVADLIPKHKSSEYYRNLYPENKKHKAMFLWNTKKICYQ